MRILLPSSDLNHCLQDMYASPFRIYNALELNTDQLVHVDNLLKIGEIVKECEYFAGNIGEVFGSAAP